MTAGSLEEQIATYTTPQLLEQLVHEKDQYTAKALEIIKKEIAKRGVTQDDIDEFTKQNILDDEGVNGNVQVTHLKKEDFVRVDGFFIHKDAVILRAIFTEEEVPFYFDVTLASAEKPSDKRELVAVFVFKKNADQAGALIASHFDSIDGIYSIKTGDIRERLHTFSFQEIQQEHIKSAEIVDVSFSQQEKNVLLFYGSRLLDDIDEIETEQQRIVFFYDHVEELIEKLGEPDPFLSVTDLLASLEILQIYCDDTDFPDAGLGIAEALIAFFQTE